MTHIALVTYKDHPDVFLGESLTRDALAARGAQVSALPWNSSGIDWREFDCVVLRSTWDYHKHFAVFRDWLNELDTQGVNLWNRPSTVRWNMAKRYLEDLGNRGVQIPQTRFIPQGSSANLAELVDASWPGAVLKPVVSASADDTYKFTADQANDVQEQLDRILRDKDAIVQEFMPEIQTEGEWALIFINSQFSHAVLKQPGADDFRVQIQYGGGQHSAEPPTTLIEQGSAILEQVPEPPLYARIDGINRNGTFVLMELELIEPYLFLEYAENAPTRFANAILAAC